MNFTKDELEVLYKANCDGHGDDYWIYRLSEDCLVLKAELEAVKRERDELASHVDRMRGVLRWGVEEANSDDELKSYEDSVIVVLRETPSQSLEAHDREVRNQQRLADIELCEKYRGYEGNMVHLAMLDIKATIEKE